MYIKWNVVATPNVAHLLHQSIIYFSA